MNNSNQYVMMDIFSQSTKKSSVEDSLYSQPGLISIIHKLFCCSKLEKDVKIDRTNFM